MKRLSTFVYHIRQGIVGIFRNGIMSITSTLVLVSCMIIVGTFYMIIDNIDRNLKSIEDINVITIYLADTLTEEQIKKIDADIEKLKNELGTIKEKTYYTKSQNLERYKQKSGTDAEFLEQYNDDNNPLPNSFEIKFTSFSDPSFKMEDIYTLKNRLDGIENIESKDIKENLSLYNKVTSVNNTLTIVAIWMMAILLVVSIFIIYITIKLGMHSRRHEISFMRYVGATKTFIRTPFIIEGILIGLFSAGISIGAQYYIYTYLITDILTEKSIIDVAQSSSLITFAPFGDYVKLLIIAFIGLGLFAGVIASSLSIKKYLKA
jgi:cell division transport system permease protein